MKKPVCVVFCVWMVVLVGCGKPDPTPLGKVTSTPSLSIPEVEYEFFANLVHEIRSAETNLTEARAKLNRKEIDLARSALERNIQLMDQLFVSKYGEEQVEAWSLTLLKIEDHQRRQALSQMRGRELLERFQDHGGSGRLNEEGYLVALSCRNTQFPKTLLRRLANCPRLAEVDLSNTQLRDYHLENLKHPHSIRRLNLSDNPINGNGLKYLTSLINLRILDLSAIQLNHTARTNLKPLTVLKHLSNLNLSNTEIPPGDTDDILRMFKTTDITF